MDVYAVADGSHEADAGAMFVSRRLGGWSEAAIRSGGLEVVECVFVSSFQLVWLVSMSHSGRPEFIYLFVVFVFFI